MAEAWPAMGGNPFSDHVNAITKYVVASESVDATAWGPTDVIAGDELVSHVQQLNLKAPPR